MTKDEQEQIEKLRLAKNAASSLLHSHPSQESKDAYRRANSDYQTARYAFDPAFRDMKIKATKQAQSNAKLGIPNSKPKKKHS